MQAVERFLTSKEAAERLGVTAGRIRQMVVDGQLPAEKFGRDLVIKESDLSLVADRKPGRPPKAEAASPKPQAVKKGRAAKAAASGGARKRGRAR
jgi:excisionase family DNA binding protein